jgi:hypothetical protein
VGGRPRKFDAEPDESAEEVARAAEVTNGLGLAGHTVPRGGSAPRSR